MDWKNETGEHFQNHARQFLLPIYPWLLNDLKNAVNSDLKGKSILEIGCGPGFMLPLFLEAHAEKVCAIDMSPAMLDLSRESQRSKGSMLVQGDACALPFAEGSFDIVFSRGSIFFWPDIDAAFASIRRILKPGGTAFIGGGYGLSTPQNIIDTILTHYREVEKKQVPRLDLDSLVELARRAGGTANLVQAKKRGFWLIWQPNEKPA